MKNVLLKTVVLGGAAVLLVGSSLALSSVGSALGASHVRPAKTKVTCNKSGAAYCFSVQNAGSGSAMEGGAIAGIGLYGSSSSSVGVWGQSNSGYGVYGTSQYNSGVGGYSQSNPGVEGASSNGNGVYGSSSSGAGVYGNSSSGNGVYGYSSNGNGGYFENGTDYEYALSIQADSAFGYLVQGYNKANAASFYVDYLADGKFAGFVQASAYYTNALTRADSKVRAFVPEATRATIEDSGTARLTNGEGAVRFDAVFAGTIDTSRGYQVFLTPTGETRGWLYVSAKFERGFIVREAEHGRSSIDFDYRVVAHPYGASDARLPRLTIQPLPHPNIKPPQAQSKRPVQP